MSDVRSEVSRWLMRTLQAGRVLRLPLLGVTAVSTLTTALRGTAAEDYTIAIVAGFAFASLVFIWAYDRFEVLNLENRHKMDRSDNFVGPGFAMNKIMMARHLGIVADGLREEKPTAEIQDELEDETLRLLREWRNGIDLSEVYDEG